MSTGITIFRGIQGIHAVDGDKPNTPNSELQYAIVAGNEKGKFTLENSLYICTPSWLATRRASSLWRSHYTIGMSTGITIFRGIHAVDGDKPNTPNSELQYAIVAGNKKGKFTLENSLYICTPSWLATRRASSLWRSHYTIGMSTGITIFRGIHAVDGDKPNTPNSELQYAIVAGNKGQVHSGEVTIHWYVTGITIFRGIHAVDGDKPNTPTQSCSTPLWLATRRASSLWRTLPEQHSC
ncbi:hypothetical protein J6590_048787 [Homalodisca vitripennis]|nr:hypothetical protein J6590_048787 [Homalodisca vitripennis]